MQGGIYRPCPVCRSNMIRRELPDWTKNVNLQGVYPQWFAYSCATCGTFVLIQPFADIKQVVKG